MYLVTPSDEIIISQATGGCEGESCTRKSLQQPMKKYMLKRMIFAFPIMRQKVAAFVYIIPLCHFTKGRRANGHIMTRGERTTHTSSCHDLVLKPQPNHLDG